MANKILKIAISIAVVSLIAIFAISCQRNTKNSESESSADYKEAETPKPEEYYSTQYNTLEFVNPVTQKPLIIKVEGRTYHDQKKGPVKETKYLIFFDPLENKVIKETKLEAISGLTRSTELRTFSNQRTYLISSANAYELDSQTLELTLVNSKLFGDIIKGGEGLKTLKFTEDGDGFELFTTEEEQIFYFPIINKTYTKDQFEKASHGFNTLLPGAKAMTYHHFTERKNEYSNFMLQLLKIKYLDNGGGPKTFQKFFVWSKTYVAGSGYVICMVIPDLKEYRRITSFKDLTPGRKYYDPKVVYEDKDVLLIRFRASGDDAAPYKLQRLNPENGEIVWTTTLAKGEDIDKLYRYKNGYYAFLNDGIALYTLDGISTENLKN
ncbi:MAG: hypothetical protein EOO20_12425 [Chryseobacterium sp.]|nr:MAG: hypothetical protein EOO20_12425 [Chryseobacterium sp.]